MSTQTPIDFTAPTDGGNSGNGGDSNALTLAAYAQQAYLEYALSVVKGRALPSYSDGQKPVQRRILYAMHRLGLGWSGNSGAKPVKGAKVVGDVLGNFHPHGDQSVYDALVRMAQDFSLRYPLIDGHGNFGSRDGDGAAAMRYTEARLAPIARLVMDEIDEGTVDFRANYDGTTQEPIELPARLPFVLLNGASGIAVGLATEIPSHNLREIAAAAVALLKDEQLSDDALFDLVPGPDFPGGGQLISAPEEIRAAYLSGRGSLKVRARWKIEDLARGQWQLVVTELPPGASTQKVLEEIEELTNPKVKAGKKTLLAEQAQLKATLLALTSLESSTPINLTMIGSDGRPTQKGLREILAEWIAFRLATVQRRTAHRLGKVRERIHVLEGRQIVLLNIDEVIRIIRAADEPKPALMERFGLSAVQADDILEIRLRQLARLEAIRIAQEQIQLKAALLAVLDAVRDESNKDAPVRLVFEPRSRTVEQGEMIALLLAHTSLETSVPLNLTMVGHDGRPMQKSLRQMLVEWIEFRRATVQRRTRHRLDKVLERIHVLEGRQLVLLNIDEVIRIIRAADEPKPALIERFALSERQADDILDIRLRQLARLEAIRIEQELQRLREDQARLEEILGNPATLKRTLIREIEADAKQHGDERRTLVLEEKRAVVEV
ncbi:DNA gyrase subunit A, partial [Roseateles sp.]|uniref:DNA gyrase subunit A n=1 Tax=Roseateles sp. TaxID=1971397 RepID=UPI003262F88E